MVIFILTNHLLEAQKRTFLQTLYGNHMFMLKGYHKNLDAQRHIYF